MIYLTILLVTISKTLDDNKSIIIIERRSPNGF